ncbi:MAG TPA: hypothetical protein DCQ93_00310 [Bacteroidetes bacterium]|nr:hypothetical protein [Bacteroidota bacterium]
MIVKKGFLLLMFLISVTCRILAQNVSAGNDTTICSGTSVTLHAQVDSAGAITQLNLPDDHYSSVVDLGFNFNYYGNTYHKCLLSTNVYIYFDTTEANGYSVWPINLAIPTTDPSVPQNSIMGPWHDVDPSVSPFGIMSYATFGSAPNRYFVFNFCGVPMFSCNNLLFTGQIILYEGSNIIETHMTSKVVCTTWNNGGAAIHGLHNITGTQASVVPNRNYPTIWTTSNDGRRFTPDSSFASYTIDTIPFQPIPMLGNLQWTTMAGAFLGNDQNVIVTPTQTTSYIVNMTDCGVGADTVTVYVSQLDTTTFKYNPACPNSFDGFIGVNCLGSAPFTITWQDQQGNTLQTVTSSTGNDTLFNLGPGTYHLTVTDSIGCVKSHYYTLSAVSYNAQFNYSPLISCKGIPTVYTNTSTGIPVSFSWNFGDGGNSSLQNPTHTFSSSGSYTVQMIATYAGGCTDTATKIIIVHDPINADFNWQPSNICDSDTVQFYDNSSQFPIIWNWTYGDGSFGSGETPTHQFQGGDYTIKLVATDSLCGTDSIEKDLTVYSTPHPNIGPDTGLCYGETIFLDAGYPSFTHSWSNGDQNQITSIEAGEPTYYSVAVNNHGCIGYDSIYIFLECNVAVPSGFSPNGDGHNDIFRPSGNKIKGYSVNIFNRWGQEVFSGDFGGIDYGWDGKYLGEDCDIGVYIYEMKIEYVNNVKEELKGNITLLR